MMVETANTVEMKNGGFWKWAFIILGVSLSTNVVNVAKIGGTYVSIAQFITLILFVFLAISGLSLIVFLKSLKKSFLFLLLLIPISVVLVFITGLSNNITTFLAGIVEMLAVLMVGILISNKKEYTDHLINGMIWGLLINSSISLISFLKWKTTGSSINFGAIFGLSSYAFYGDSSYFRTQGLFTESSYFLCYSCVTIPFVILRNKTKINTMLLLALTLLATALSLSGNVLILFIEIVLCAFYKIRFEENASKRSFLLFLVFLISFSLIAVALVFRNSSFVSNIIGKVLEALRGSNLEDVGNKERFTNMTNAVSLIKTNIMGFGYNMGAVAISANFPGSSGAASTFLRMFLDLGIAGGLLYCLMFLEYSIFNIFNKKRSVYLTAIGISLIGLFACQVANGYPLASVLSIVLLTCASFNIETLKNSNTSI